MLVAVMASVFATLSVPSGRSGFGGGSRDRRFRRRFGDDALRRDHCHEQQQDGAVDDGNHTHPLGVRSPIFRRQNAKKGPMHWCLDWLNRRRRREA